MKSTTLVTCWLFAIPAMADEPKTLKLLQSIPLLGKPGRLDHLAIDAKGERLFVANLSNDTLDIVDLKAGKLVKQITGQKKAQGVAYAPNLNRVYQGNGTDNVCNVFDGASFKILHTLPMPDADNVRFSTDTGLVYVGHAEKSITAFDAKNYAVKATVKLPGSPESFQLDPERKRLFVNCLNPATLAVIDTEKHELIASHKLTLTDACYPLAYDAKTQRVFVGCRKKPMVVILDGPTGKELAGIPIPADIDDLFFDAKRKRLYASCGEGFIAVLEEKKANEFTTIEKIAVPKVTRTCFFDPASDRLFVPIPKQEGDDGPILRIYKALD